MYTFAILDENYNAHRYSRHNRVLSNQYVEINNCSRINKIEVSIISYCLANAIDL